MGVMVSGDEFCKLSDGHTPRVEVVYDNRARNVITSNSAGVGDCASGDKFRIREVKQAGGLIEAGKSFGDGCWGGVCFHGIISGCAGVGPAAGLGDGVGFFIIFFEPSLIHSVSDCFFG